MTDVVAKKPRSEAQLANDKRLSESQRATAVFKSAEDFTDQFEEYLKDQDDTFSKRPPSFSRFADWLGLRRSLVISYVNKWPEAERIVRAMLADVLVEHAIIGEYRDAVSIFNLKNSCNWVDKKETISTSRSTSIATPDEARANIRKIKESLGFDDHGRPGLVGKKNVSDMEARIIQLAEAKNSVGDLENVE